MLLLSSLTVESKTHNVRLSQRLIVFRIILTCTIVYVLRCNTRFLLCELYRPKWRKINNRNQYRFNDEASARTVDTCSSIGNAGCVRVVSNTYNVEAQYYILVVVAHCRITWYQVWPSHRRTWLKAITRGETIHQNFYFRVVRDYPASAVTLCAPKTVAPNSYGTGVRRGKKKPVVGFRRLMSYWVLVNFGECRLFEALTWRKKRIPIY